MYTVDAHLWLSVSLREKLDISPKPCRCQTLSSPWHHRLVLPRLCRLWHPWIHKVCLTCLHSRRSSSQRLLLSWCAMIQLHFTGKALEASFIIHTQKNKELESWKFQYYRDFYGIRAKFVSRATSWYPFYYLLWCSEQWHHLCSFFSFPPLMNFMAQGMVCTPISKPKLVAAVPSLKCYRRIRWQSLVWSK